MKRALLVGINEYEDAPLRGCVPDIQNVYNVVIEEYGFHPDNVRLLLDRRATKAAIIVRLRWLINEAKSGDTLLFYYSGHGSQIRDRDGDELRDRLDEILCPVDLCWDDPLSDDVLKDVFSKLKKNIHLYVVLDCCHSGTGTRSIGPPHGQIDRHTKEGNLEKLSARYHPPPLDIWYRSWKRELPVNKLGVKQTRDRDLVPDNSMRHVLIAGARADQTAADAIMGGKPCGALTHCLLATLAKDKAGEQPVNEAVADVSAMLSNYRFSQEVQLEGPGELLTKPFLSDPEV